MRLSPVHVHRAAIVAGSVVTLGIFIALSSLSGAGTVVALEATFIVAESLPWVALWIGAAAGFGWPLRAALAPVATESASSAPTTESGPALQVAFGIAIMLSLNAALGRMGALQMAGGAGAWALTAIGVALLAAQVIRRRRLQVHREPSTSIVVWCAAPAFATLLLASTSAPGWLWDTEYGGYDALSYHLQLPREWLALGAIQPLEHNVYSFLPGFMEAAFHHLMLMRRDPLAAAYACQLLHAAIGVTAAFVTGRLAVRLTGSMLCGAVAFVLVIGTPWVVVAGSLPYNEMPVLLMLAAGLLLIHDGISPSCPTTARTQDSEPGTRNAALRLGAGVGLLAAAACGAKLTALGFVALPLAILMLWNVPPRRWLHAGAAGGAVALLVLASWLASNGLATRNPVFPFATGLLGTGHWAAEQVAAWNAGHQPDRPVAARFVEAWHQLARYGIGTAPATEERWHAQWSILPWLAAVAVLTLLAARSRRRLGLQLGVVIAIQIAFWIAATHVKSRFMLPMVIPAAVSVAVMISLVRDSISSARSVRAGVLLSAALLLWSAAPAWVFTKQAGRMPALAVGLAHAWSGDALDPAARAKSAKLRATVHLNHRLPAGSRVLFIGEAAPFYFTGDFTYNTTWDRGPLSRLLREHDEAAAVLAALRREGYTHLFVNSTMLKRWEQAGWNDSLITPERIERLAEAIGSLERQWPAGEALYRLQPIAASPEAP